MNSLSKRLIALAVVLGSLLHLAVAATLPDLKAGEPGSIVHMQLANLGGHEALFSVGNFEFSPDGRHLVVCGDRPGDRLKVLALEPRSVLFDVETPGIRSFRCDVGQTYIAVLLHNDRSIQVRAFSSGEMVAPILEFRGTVADYRFSPDGRYLAVEHVVVTIRKRGDKDFRVPLQALTVVDLKTGGRVFECASLNWHVETYEFTRDGDRLIVAGAIIEDGDTPAHQTLRVYQLGKPIAKAVFNRSEPFGDVEIDEVSSHIVIRPPRSGGIVADNLRILDIETTQVTTLPSEFARGVVFDDATKILVDGQVFRIADGQRLGMLADPRAALERCIRGKLIFRRNWDKGDLIVDDLESGKRLYVMHHVRLAAFSPNEKYLAVVTGEGEAKLYDSGSGHEILSFEVPVGTILDSQRPQPQTPSFSFTSDSTRLTLKQPGNRGTLIWTLDGKVGFVAPPETKISPNGRWLATLKYSKVTLRNIEGDEVGELDYHRSNIMQVLFNRDGDRLFTLSYESVCEWDLSKRAFVRRWLIEDWKQSLTPNKKNDLIGINGLCYTWLADKRFADWTRVEDDLTWRKPPYLPERSQIFSQDGKRLFRIRNSGFMPLDDQGLYVRTVVGEELYSLRPDGYLRFGFGSFLKGDHLIYSLNSTTTVIDVNGTMLWKLPKTNALAVSADRSLLLMSTWRDKHHSERRLYQWPSRKMIGRLPMGARWISPDNKYVVAENRHHFTVYTVDAVMRSTLDATQGDALPDRNTSP